MRDTAATTINPAKKSILRGALKKHMKVKEVRAQKVIIKHTSGSNSCRTPPKPILVQSGIP